MASFFDVVQQRMQHRRVSLLQRPEALMQPIAQFLVIADIQSVQQGIGAVAQRFELPFRRHLSCGVLTPIRLANW